MRRPGIKQLGDVLSDAMEEVTNLEGTVRHWRGEARRAMETLRDAQQSIAETLPQLREAQARESAAWLAYDEAVTVLLAAKAAA